jgi:hypothetical protein
MGIANNILANTIFIIHLAIILFVIIAPFTEITVFHILQISLGFTLLIHWFLNSDICSLTLLEGSLRGIPSNDTFIGKFIKPLYNINENNWAFFIKIITIILVMISSYKLLGNEKFIILSKSKNFSDFKIKLKSLLD